MRLTFNLLLCCFFAVNFNASAQKAKTIKPKKPPVLRTYLGEFSGNISMPKTAVVSAIKLPLVIRDKNSKSYTLSSYQFIVKQFNQAEQEDGKIIRDSLQSGNLLKTTPLPAPWQNRVSEDLRSGDEVKFVDVIVKDSTGQAFHASDLLIRIK
jgi:hypothetical protein